jgi:lysophospholipase L1-like esterase
MMPPRKGILHRGLTGLLVMAVLLGLAEGVVRLLTPSETPDGIHAYDALQRVPTVPARHMLEPDQDLTLEGIRDDAGGRAGELRYRINHAGYRGMEVAVPKPAGTIRVVILGGSAVFDPAASEGEDWPSRIQEKLRSRGYDKVEIVNGGIPAHASLDSLGRLYTQVWTFEPDFVLIYDAWSDIRYFVELSPREPAYWLFKPHDPKADSRNIRGPLERALSHSQLYVKLRHRTLSWARQRKTEGSVRGGPLAEQYPSTGVEQYRLDLGLLVEASREIGATPVLITQATLVSASSRDSEQGKIRYEDAHLTPAALFRAFQECADALWEVARRKGVAVLDAQAVLGGRAELFADQVHLTGEGREALADLVAGFLGDALGSPAPPAAHPAPGEREITRVSRLDPGAGARPPLRIAGVHP